MTNRLIRKAATSVCNYKVAAVALDHEGSMFAYANNKPRHMRQGGGEHAEMVLMRRYGRAISKILIVRTNKSGDILPIDPCESCAAVAKGLGIKIMRYED